MSYNKCTNKANEIQKVLEELVIQANDICQFSQRNTELKAERFVQVLVLGWLQKADASLNELAEMAGNLGCKVTGAAIHGRINQVAVTLLGHILMEAIRHSVPYQRLPIGALSSFTAVHITDSTQLSLPKSLEIIFAGGNQNAKMKLQVTIDYLTGQWVALEIEAGKAADRASELPVQQAIGGSLNLFDLGYFKQERLLAIIQQDAYFVSRCQSQVALYHLDTYERIDVVVFLQSMKADQVDTEIRLGSRTKLPIRLVARKLPQSIVDKRRRLAKKKAREQGYTCSASYLYILSWDILITNLSADEWTLNQIFDIYPIRMQIEWVFRIWKSQLQVDYIGNWRLERVLCQLYAHLIGVLLCHRLTMGWLWHSEREHSFAKCVHIVQQKIEGLMLCIKRQWWGIHAWMRRLDESFDQFGHKTKRKKDPSTLQILRDWSLT